MDVDYRWRADISDAEVNGLTRSYGGQAEDGWWDRIRPHSLGWATARLRDGTPVAARGATEAGGEWLHVDFRDELAPFYLDACGFAPTAAGVLRLS